MTNAQVSTEMQSETNLQLLYASCELYPAKVFYMVLSQPQMSAREFLQEQLRWGVVKHIAEHLRWHEALQPLKLSRLVDFQEITGC